MDFLLGLPRILMVAFGIGLVIFVHELGHYIAARICRVRVVTFSLGFGPRLIGWRRGATMYQIAAVPLGGYCRMAGEERQSDVPPRGDELMAKSIGARFFIYSGGVLMNVAFALVVFPILFQVGVPFLRPMIGAPAPGGPAWHAGLEAGSEVVRVNGNEVFDFVHIPTEVALGNPKEAVLAVRAPGSDVVREYRMAPEKNDDWGVLTIGVGPALERDELGRAALEVREDFPAYEAGLRSGDRLVAVVDGVPGLDILEQIQVAIRDGAPLTLSVLSEGSTSPEVKTVVPVESTATLPPRVGIMPPRNHVRAVRGTRVDEIGIRTDDRLIAVRGRRILRVGDLEQALAAADTPLTFELLRGSQSVTLEAPELSPEEALALAADIALAPDLETSQVLVNPGEPAYAAGMRDLDRIREIDQTPVENWSDVTDLISSAGTEKRGCALSVERAGAGDSQYLDLVATPQSIPFPDYGLNLRQAEYVYQTKSLVDAIRVGTFSSWKFLKESWLTLKGMITGNVASDNIGGIISIGAVSYSLAESGTAKLFFFLCMLSINLAFLNVLPIPVLDGGHLFFLIVEKIKGSPVSERVLGYSQMVGVVLILSLMVYVTYNDLVRWVLSG